MAVANSCAAAAHDTENCTGKEQWTTATTQIRNLNLRPWIWLAAITLLTTACVWGLMAIAPWENMVPDFVCYWAAGELIASGRSPYEVGLQAVGVEGE